MNSHHESIKLTVETNPTRFLGTAFNVNRDGSMTTKVFRKPGKFGSLKYLKGTIGIIKTVSYIEPLRLLLILIQKFLS